MYQLKLEGLCCSSIIIQLGLDLRNEENDQFVRSVRALCNGMHSGLVCGALTGAVCMLALFDERNIEMTKDMVGWFQEEYGRKYGGIDCEDITSNDPYNRAVICPDLMKAAYMRAKQLLIDFGYIFEE